MAIVGAENCLLAPDTMETPISSVDTNLELLGYRGASLLDDCMSGKASPAEPVRIPPAGLIVRKSSEFAIFRRSMFRKMLRSPFSLNSYYLLEL